MSKRKHYNSILVKTVVAFVVMILCQQVLYAQDWAFNREQLIQRLLSYRSELLLRDTKTTYNLRELISKWHAIDENAANEHLSQFVLNLLVGVMYFEESYDEFIESQKKYNSESPLIEGFSPQDYHAVTHNLELIDLINLGVLSNKYPYTIDGSCDVFKELQYYEIKRDDVIAEVGAGNGMFSLLLALMSDDIGIHINEIQDLYVAYIETKIRLDTIRFGSTRLKAVLGEKCTANLPDKTFDKIIIRNSFHHFSKKKQMLQSIKNALKSGGALYILEYPVELRKAGEDFCKKGMQVQDIKKVLTKNDFMLVDELQINEALLLHYVVNTSSRKKKTGS